MLVRGGYAEYVERRRPLLLREARPSAALGIVVAAAAVAAITALIYPLGQVMPEVSAGVLYLLAVLAISTYWGLRLGLLTSVLSAAAFNFFHIPPTGRFTIAEPQNWVALAVFFTAAVLASSVAELARARAVEAEVRRREAVLAAEMATLLLGGGRVADALDETADRLAQALGLRSARIALGSSASGPGKRAIPLHRDRRMIGTLIVPADSDPESLERLGERIVPALETLLAAALERERLQAEAVEAGALRRSDEIKTALLRSVSHDLRTPLTAIVASGDALASATLTGKERTELADALTDRRRASPGWSISSSISRSWKPAPPSRGATGARSRRSPMPRPSTPQTRRCSSSRSTASSRSSTPTRRRSSARSRTCSRTPCATRAASRCRFEPALSAHG